MTEKTQPIQAGSLAVWMETFPTPTTIAATVKTPDAVNERGALEAAFTVIHPKPSEDWKIWNSARIAEQRPEDQAAFTLWNDWRMKTRLRFTCFLDAKAYTDAALMLVPDGWQCVVVIFSDGSAEAILTDDRVNPVRLNDIERMGETPALAITLAALSAATGEA